MMNTQDTICAVATAPGGAIGVIRISGKEAISIADKIFLPAKGCSLAERKPYTLVYGYINNVDNEIIDEVLVSLFHGTHSYTGENSVEISCHGSNYILQQVMQLLILNGCRAALPGEFTQRAFLNGKMDLSQAEAVADLIASDSAVTHRLAMNQMRGGFSKELAFLRAELLHLTSLMELELDFSDHEELEFADRTELKQIALKIETIINELVLSFSVGNAIRNGVPVAIVGETNAGKSTLLNALLNEEKAIVSDIHGTTRDVIEDVVNIEGVTFRFIDTAGIRETKDTIESIGIERSFQKMMQAEIVLWVIDLNEAKQQYLKLADKILSYCTDKPLIIVLNKVDNLLNTDEISTYIKEKSNHVVFPISAKTKLGIKELEKQLLEILNLPKANESNLIVTNMRHYDALTRALSAIKRVQEGMDIQLSGDLISQDLRECLFHLAEIVGGEITTDEVLGNIFKNFCVGK